MKTIVWKELREHGFWVPLALLATSLITMYAMISQDLLLNQLELMTPTVFAAAIIASLLGVLQSWGDRRLESRALLLHRSVTAKEAFTAKLVAGLLMYSLATLPPLIIAAFWIAIDGRQTMAAYWDEMLPVSAYTLLAFMCWPASFLVVQRNAWWIGSRLFPLLSVFWILAFSVMSNDANAPSEMRWVGLILAAFAAVTLSFAAYNTFVSLGQVKGAPRVALGMLHGFSLLVAAIAVAGSVHNQRFQRAYLEGTSTYYSVGLGLDGEPILTSREQKDYQVQVSKVAKLSTEGSVLDKLKEVEPKKMSIELPGWHLYNSNHNLASMNASRKTFQILGTLARRMAESSTAKGVNPKGANPLQRGMLGGNVEQQLPAWIYVLDRRSGKILVYSEGKQLIHELTPEKATGAMRFGNLADKNCWNGNFYYSPYSSRDVPKATQRDTHLVVAFEDAVYVLENDGVTVTRFFDMPDSGPLIASSPGNHFGHGVVDQGLRFGDRLVLIQPQTDKDFETTSEIATVEGSKYFQTTVTLPKQLVDKPLLQIARLPGSTDELVTLATKGDDKYLWIRLNVGGEVLEERTYHQPTPATGPTYNQGPEVWVAALFPVSGLCLVAIILSVSQGLEHFGWDYWSAYPSASIAICIFLVLQIVVALSLTYWACRYYRLSKAVTRRWLLASLVGGPFVGLGLITVYTRVATQTCVACRKKCRADIEECEHCHQALDQPSRRGIEIFDDERVDAVAPVAV